MTAQLVEAGGTADQADVACVATALAALPKPAVELLHARGLGVVACRKAVTDFAAELRDVHPRGWKELGYTQTWDDVPGAYLPDRRKVVIATSTRPDGTRGLPDSGTHGSCNIVVHETMHAIDYSERHRRSADPRFVAARTADRARLTSYELQDGAAGLEETYAESAARTFGADLSSGTMPSLTAFWRSTDAWAPVRATRRRRSSEPSDRLYVGSGRIEGDQAIHRLIARDASGAIGHMIVVRPAPPTRGRRKAGEFAIYAEVSAR